MRNRVKIFNNSEIQKINFFVMNDNGGWIAVPVESELSRSEYTGLSINDDASKILDYINENYCIGEEIDLVLENFTENPDLFLSVAEGYENIRVIKESLRVIVIGREGTGKSTLIESFGVSKRLEKTENYEQYISNGIEWNEIRGLNISQGTFSAIEETIKEIACIRNISIIMYCINAKNGRIENVEIELMRFAQACIPNARTIFVITNSIDDVSTATLIEEINKLVDDVPCLSILAKDEETKIGTITAFGIDKLKRYIFEGIL